MPVLAAVLQIVGLLVIVAGVYVLFNLGGALVAGGAGLFVVGFAIETQSNA
jgi:hypothetical protein